MHFYILLLQESELTGAHTPELATGRSLPPLGAIQIICDPLLNKKQ